MSRELDAMVAERVMGKIPCQAESHRDGSAPWSCHATPEHPDQGGETPCYSTDIGAAWEVVEALTSRLWFVDLCQDVRGWAATFGRAGRGDEDIWIARSSHRCPSAAEAICYAALKAAEEDA